MADLIIYNAEYVPPTGHGLVNKGATCYFNSLIQALLSCSSLNEAIARAADEYFGYKQLVCNALIGHPGADDIGRLWIEFLRTASARRHFNMGQQCAGEALIFLINEMDAILPKYGIARLFTHRIQTLIYCENCDQWRMVERTTDMIFNVEPTHMTSDLNVFLTGNKSDVDKDHICDLCGFKGSKERLDTPTMLPEVLVVLNKKYNNKLQNLPNRIKFPEQLIFAKGRLVYSAVAQIEHVGAVGGGHYWAICKRRDGWWCLNDTSIQRVAGFGSTPNTYIVVYHITQTSA